MAGSLISTILKPKAFKIYDESSNIQVWDDVSVMQVDFESGAATSSNPISTYYLQTSEQTSDALTQDLLMTKVINPLKIVLSANIESISTSMSVINSFSDVTKTFKVQSKGILGEKMAITDIEIDQSPEMLSAIKLNITFEQTGKNDTTSFSAKSSSDDSTYGATVQSSDSTNTVSDLYSKLSNILG